jgi:hypothetical protein
LEAALILLLFSIDTDSYCFFSFRKGVKAVLRKLGERGKIPDGWPADRVKIG